MGAKPGYQLPLWFCIWATVTVVGTLTSFIIALQPGYSGDWAVWWMMIPCMVSWLATVIVLQVLEYRSWGNPDDS